MGLQIKGVFSSSRKRENSSSVTCKCPRARSHPGESGATGECGAKVVLSKGKLILG